MTLAPQPRPVATAVGSPPLRAARLLAPRGNARRASTRLGHSRRASRRQPVATAPRSPEHPRPAPSRGRRVAVGVWAGRRAADPRAPRASGSSPSSGCRAAREHVTDAPWLPLARALAARARPLARALPAQRARDDADGVGMFRPVGADAGRRGHLAGRAPAHRPAPRARAREAARLPDALARAARVRALLVQPAGLDGGAAAAHRARARLRRSRARRRHARSRLRATSCSRSRASCGAGRFPARARRRQPGDGAALAARGTPDGDSRSERSALRRCRAPAPSSRVRAVARCAVVPLASVQPWA